MGLSFLPPKDQNKSNFFVDINRKQGRARSTTPRHTKPRTASIFKLETSSLLLLR